jgi:hypothetical protein
MVWQVPGRSRLESSEAAKLTRCISGPLSFRPPSLGDSACFGRSRPRAVHRDLRRCHRSNQPVALHDALERAKASSGPLLRLSGRRNTLTLCLKFSITVRSAPCSIFTAVPARRRVRCSSSRCATTTGPARMGAVGCSRSLRCRRCGPPSAAGIPLRGGENSYRTALTGLLPMIPTAVAQEVVCFLRRPLQRHEGAPQICVRGARWIRTGATLHCSHAYVRSSMMAWPPAGFMAISSRVEPVTSNSSILTSVFQTHLFHSPSL